MLRDFGGISGDSINPVRAGGLLVSEWVPCFYPTCRGRSMLTVPSAGGGCLFCRHDVAGGGVGGVDLACGMATLVAMFASQG